MPKTILVRTTVTVDDAEIDRLFREKLSALKRGMWIDENGRLMVEHYTSHRFDSEVEPHDPGYRHKGIVAAVQALETELQKLTDKA